MSSSGDARIEQERPKLFGRQGIVWLPESGVAETTLDGVMAALRGKYSDQPRRRHGVRYYSGR